MFLRLLMWLLDLHAIWAWSSSVPVAIPHGHLALLFFGGILPDSEIAGAYGPVSGEASSFATTGLPLASSWWELRPVLST